MGFGEKRNAWVDIKVGGPIIKQSLPPILECEVVHSKLSPRQMAKKLKDSVTRVSPEKLFRDWGP